MAEEAIPPAAGAAGGVEGATAEAPAVRGSGGAGGLIAANLAVYERRLAIARAKREHGEAITTRERYLLACEDRNVTPEALVAILGRVAATAKRASVRVLASRELAALRDGPDPEAPPPAPPPPGVTVNVGVGVSLTVADLEAARESARKKLTAIMARVSSVPSRVVDSEGNGSHGGNGSASAAADGAGGGSGPAAGGP